MVYENTNYIVEISEDRQGYDVINKNTGVTEATTAHLPGAMMTSDTYDEYLIKQGREASKNETNVITLRQVDPK